MSMCTAELAPATASTDGFEATPGDRTVVDRRPRSEIVNSFLTANPLVAPALGMVAGIWIDSAQPVPVWLAVGAFILAGGMIRFVRRSGLEAHIVLLLAAAAVGAVLHDLSFRRWPADHVARYATEDGVAARLRGTIVSTPVIRAASASSAVWYPQMPRTRFVLSAESLSGHSASEAVSGLVSVVVSEPVLNASAGDCIDLYGKLRTVGSPDNPGSIDWSLAQRRKGVLAEFGCRRSGDVKPIGSESWGVRRWIDRLRRRARAGMLEATYPGDVPGSGLLAGMVLGQRSAIDPELNDAFVRSGTVHYLSVSGAHVGMLVGAVWGAGLLLGLGRRRCAAWAMVAATGYAVLAEPSAPIVRAAIMTDLACVAMLVNRPPRAANCLALSVLVLLIVQPTQLFDAGFQLSYLTLISLIYVSPRAYYAGRALYRRLARRDDPLLSPEIQQQLGMRSPRWAYWDLFVRGLGWYVAIGLSASVVGALLSAFHFHQVQCYGWINTIILMPLITAVTVLGLVKTGVAVVAPLLSGPMGWLLARLTDLLIVLVRLLADVPGAAFATPALPVWLVAFGLAVIGLWTLQPVLRLAVCWSRLAGLLLLVVAAWTLSPPAPQPSLSMQVLSVGNGMASVIQLPNGKTVLYDVGCFPPYDLEKWTVGPLLSRERCWRVDAVVLSHANLDHYGGVLDLMDRRRVARVITTPHFEHAGQAHSTSRNLMTRLNAQAKLWHQCARGARLAGTGDASLEVLWPPVAEIGQGDTNDTSLVLRISYARKRILACGDIEELAMRQLMATADLRADVLILPHHGSVTPSTVAFVRAVNPRYCIRSTHRHETSPALREAVTGRRFFSTAEHGAIEIRLKPDEVAVRPTLMRLP
jgi:competence protein ComEC